MIMHDVHLKTSMQIFVSFTICIDFAKTITEDTKKKRKKMTCKTIMRTLTLGPRAMGTQACNTR